MAILPSLLIAKEPDLPTNLCHAPFQSTPSRRHSLANKELPIPVYSSLLTTEETAAWLGLNPHTLEVWRSVGRYPELEYIKVGRLVRYKLAAVELFLDSRTVTAAE